MEKQIIGFATEFYTLWSYHAEKQYTTDAYGQHHLTGVKHVYTYFQNISKDIEVVKAKYPGVAIDESLRGKTRSYSNIERIELPANFFSYGKHQGKTIDDVAKTDFQYLIWFSENQGGAKAKLIKDMPEVVAYYAEQERLKKERNGEPVLLSNGKNEITISTNGLSDFYYPYDGIEKYNYKSYMVAVLKNEKGFQTNVKIILDEVKAVNGMYPYLMPIINGKAMRTKNKTIVLELNILKTLINEHEAYQIAIIK